MKRKRLLHHRANATCAGLYGACDGALTVQTAWRACSSPDGREHSSSRWMLLWRSSSIYVAQGRPVRAADSMGVYSRGVMRGSCRLHGRPPGPEVSTRASLRCASLCSWHSQPIQIIVALRRCLPCHVTSILLSKLATTKPAALHESGSVAQAPASQQP